MRLIEELRQYCLEHRMTQQELAKKLGVTLLTVNRWFTDKYNPRALQEYQIKKLLNIKNYSYGDDYANSQVKDEESPYYGSANNYIEQIKLIKDAKTGNEEISISYVSDQNGKRIIRNITLSGKKLVKMIEKDQGAI